MRLGVRRTGHNKIIGSKKPVNFFLPGCSTLLQPLAPLQLKKTDWQDNPKFPTIGIPQRRILRNLEGHWLSGWQLLLGWHPTTAINIPAVSSKVSPIMKHDIPIGKLLAYLDLLAWLCCSLPCISWTVILLSAKRKVHTRGILITNFLRWTAFTTSSLTIVSLDSILGLLLWIPFCRWK